MPYLLNNNNQTTFLSEENVQYVHSTVNKKLGEIKHSEPLVLSKADALGHMRIIEQRYNSRTAVLPPQMSGICMNFTDKYLTERVINELVSSIRTNVLIAQQNNQLTAWTNVLGSFNKHGLTNDHPTTSSRLNNNYRKRASFATY
jgi:primase-polymerase (primpol)-like protein